MNMAEVRRHPDGCIDFDFYRVDATALRGQAMREAFKLKLMFRFTLTVVASLIAFALAAGGQATPTASYETSGTPSAAHPG